MGATLVGVGAGGDRPARAGLPEGDAWRDRVSALLRPGGTVPAEPIGVPISVAFHARGWPAAPLHLAGDALRRLAGRSGIAVATPHSVADAGRTSGRGAR
jgi:hypothetical protein